MGKKLKDVFFILILGSVSTLLLVGIKSYTYPKISFYQERTFKTAILEAANIAHEAGDFEQAFARNIRKKQLAKTTYYLSPDNLYIFAFEGRGLWGLIHGLITLRPDLETIESLRIISQEETPGLGARIAEESFLNQFISKKVSPKLDLVMRRKSTQDNEIDSISGASMTSKALIDMINQSVESFRVAIKN
jgi:Na+-transporting NADH:ubiquinone oxidoreductase subunit C